MRTVSILLVCASLGCGKAEPVSSAPRVGSQSGSAAPPPAPSASLVAPWSMSLRSQMFGVAVGPLDLIELDSTGAIHHHLGELDLGSWPIPADPVAEAAALLGGAGIAALHDVEPRGEGMTWGLTVHSAAGDRELSIAGELPPALQTVFTLLDKQLEAHAKTELAALGPFSIAVTNHFDYNNPKAVETVIIDQTGVARQLRGGAEIAHRDVSLHRLAYIATLLRLPAMIAVAAPPAAEHPITFVIKRDNKVQNIATDLRAMPAPLATLYTELASEQAGFPR